MKSDLKEFQFKLSKKADMEIFSCKDHSKSRDILSLASSVFNLEKYLKENDAKFVTFERFDENNSNILRSLLSELISIVLLKSIHLEFFIKRINLYKKKCEFDRLEQSKAVILFSGGIDSYGGLFWSKEFFKNDFLGVFCAHSDQKWAIRIVKNINQSILVPNKINLKILYSPAISARGYSQLRGFYYIVSAGAWMNILNSDTLVISECGPTMHQPRFGPYDQVTMTTHPIIVEIAKKTLEVLLGKKVNIYLPFENMTKAEVISYVAPFSDIKSTHSCISQRFGRHDGTCYGCVIRRLGSITAGSNDVDYIRNPILDDNVNNNNLISLLLFSFDLLTNYSDMPFYQIENIESFNKKDLFERFALDNFAAIHILVRNGNKLNKNIMNIYCDLINHIGENKLEERIKNVRGKNYQINERPIV